MLIVAIEKIGSAPPLRESPPLRLPLWVTGCPGGGSLRMDEKVFRILFDSRLFLNAIDTETENVTGKSEEVDFTT